jgi:hypothetical protein
MLFCWLDLAAVPRFACTCTRQAATLRADDSIWRSHARCRLKAVGLERAINTCNGMTDGSPTTWRRVLQLAVPPPQRLIKDASSTHLVLKAAPGLSLRFAGPLGHDRACRVDTPMPTKPFATVRFRGERLAEISDVVYFEAQIEDSPLSEGAGGVLDPCVSIGLCSNAFKLKRKQAGWDTNSLGYHGDDGFLYHGTGLSSHRYGPRFGAGDHVGCGLHLPSMLVFFTLNGTFLGPAFHIWRMHVGDAEWLYPAIGIDSHQRIELNFGHEPFSFDPARVEALIAASRRRPLVWDGSPGREFAVALPRMLERVRGVSWLIA